MSAASAVPGACSPRPHHWRAAHLCRRLCGRLLHQQGPGSRRLVWAWRHPQGYQHQPPCGRDCWHCIHSLLLLSCLNRIVCDMFICLLVQSLFSCCDHIHRKCSVGPYLFAASCLAVHIISHDVAHPSGQCCHHCLWLSGFPAPCGWYHPGGIIQLTCCCVQARHTRHSAVCLSVFMYCACKGSVADCMAAT